MAWQNVIVGYKIKRFTSDKVIPKDAIFLCLTRECVEEGTLVSRPFYANIYHYHIPIYKKENIKNKK